MRFGLGKRKADLGHRPRLRLGAVPLVYAVGDVHGHLELLREVEEWIVTDAHRFGMPASIVMVGDYIDRGPDSAGVLAHLLQPAPPGLTRYCIAGNHEAALLDFLIDPTETSNWLVYGGVETLASYGLGREELRRLLHAPEALLMRLDTLIPAEHLGFIAALPALIETDDAIFVHAGLRPRVPLAEQAEQDLIWIRDDYRESYAEFGKMVVHGHTPRDKPLVTPSRIAIDTGAFATGRLTAVRLMPGRPPKLFST